MGTRRRRRDWLTVGKDLAIFAVGLALIVKQGWFVPRGEFNLWVLLFGGVLAQVPGVLGMIALWRGAGSPSPPAPESPQSLPASPSDST